MRVRFFLFILLLLLPATAAGGPWTPEPGGGYAKVQVRWLPGVGYFSGLGEAPSLYGVYNEIFLGGFFVEVGLLPRVSASLAGDGVRLFFLQDPRDNSVSSHASFGEPTLTVTVQPIQAGRFALSVAGFVRVPGAPNTPVAEVVSLADGNPVVGQLRVGTGVIEGGGTLSAGVGLGRVYLAASAGVLGRGGGWDTVLQWSAEAGLSVGKAQRTQLRLRLSGFHPLKNGTAGYHDSPSGIGNGTAYTGFALEVDRKITDLLSAGFSFAGGLGGVVRQTGGPVITGQISAAWP